MHAVLRIDQVEKQGVSKISAAEGANVTQFPMPVYTPGGPGWRQGHLTILLRLLFEHSDDFITRGAAGWLRLDPRIQYPG